MQSYIRLRFGLQNTALCIEVMYKASFLAHELIWNKLIEECCPTLDIPVALLLHHAI